MEVLYVACTAHTTNVTTNRAAENKVGVVEGYTNLHLFTLRGVFALVPVFVAFVKSSLYFASSY